MRLAFALAVIMAVVGAPASASTYTKVKMECAVGGERFTATVQMSMTSFGQRPDGKLYNTGMAPLPECPGNGLVHYKDEFSKEEVARLTPFVESQEYQALRRVETPEYRTYWLLEKMGGPPDEIASALLAATWSSDSEPGRKARYQRAYVERLAGLEATPTAIRNWFWLNLRAADLWRELGDFDRSNALLAKLDRPDNLPSDKDELEGARRLIDGLLALNADRNTKPEPTNLIPTMLALELCKDQAKLSPAELEACRGPEIEEARREIGQ